MLHGLREEADELVIDGLRSRGSNRRRSQEEREKIIGILSEKLYRGFGPMLASEYQHLVVTPANPSDARIGLGRPLGRDPSRTPST